MSMRRWLLAGVICATGCATFGGGEVSDRDVARLPAPDRQQIMEAHRSIDVAQANVNTAKLQRDEAQQFRKIASSELGAARQRQEAARGAIELARSTRDPEELRIAQRDDDVTRSQAIDARAKLDYADRLVALRSARVDEAEAQLRAAHADVEMQKAQMVEREGVGNPDMNRFRRERDNAEEQLAQTRAHVAALAGEVAQLRTSWLDRQRESSTAARGTSVAPMPPPMPPPPPRSMLPNQGPRGDVNDTPAAPEQPQSQEGNPGIAPNP